MKQPAVEASCNMHQEDEQRTQQGIPHEVPKGANRIEMETSTAAQEMNMEGVCSIPG